MCPRFSIQETMEYAFAYFRICRFSINSFAAGGSFFHKFGFVCISNDAPSKIFSFWRFVSTSNQWSRMALLELMNFPSNHGPTKIPWTTSHHSTHHPFAERESLRIISVLNHSFVINIHFTTSLWSQSLFLKTILPFGTIYSAFVSASHSIVRSQLRMSNVYGISLAVVTFESVKSPSII